MSKPRKYSLFPKALSDYVEPLTRPIFKAQGVANARLFTQWPHIVGARMAENSRPLKLSFPAGKTKEGTLTVAVAGGFATEIQHMQPMILERINTYFGYKAVSRLTISHNFSTAAVPMKKPKKPSAISIDESRLDTVNDLELKSALTSLAKTLQHND